MNHAQIQTASSDLMATLWAKKFLPLDHPLVSPYLSEQEVRNCIRRYADSFGLRVAKQGSNLHLLVQPHDSILTNPISELKKTVKTYQNRIDLYLLGVVWMVLCAEADNDIDTSKIKWENEGLSYAEIEDLVSKNLEQWYEKDKASDGQFSKEWSLAVKDMYNKWKILRYSKVENGRIQYVKDSRLGVIDCAVKELEKDRMVYIERTATTSRATPTPVFFERLKARFGNMDRYQDRYELIQVLFQDTKESGEVGA
ncbi:DUF6063 family protein [Bacillus sp. 1P10SD]|uniref:DUF6063 family protein n=1 Tax=Bacillus sp. 1P10SD TaxID=3132265 RepID=UPI0039A492A3